MTHSKYQVEKLETATNSQGEVFNAGDFIQVQDLKSRPTTAKIEYFYAEPRGMMAVYSPAEADGRGLGRGFQAPEPSSGDSPLAFPHERPVQEDQESGWEWSQGCCLLDTLVRV